MNILTFDTEEWFVEKQNKGDRKERHSVFDYYLKSILDFLDEQNLKATFFCVGGLAREFPSIVKDIADRGHEIGCHSDVHKWLSTFDRDALCQDTKNAIDSLENLVGKKVISYRAPAFSIGMENKWALEILAEYGIQRDASIFPATRDFGGFAGFPAAEPCLVKVGDAVLKEFPIPMTNFFGKEIAYSGGGYFRLFPTVFLKNRIEHYDYVMTYFHIGDLEYCPLKMLSSEQYEQYFNQPGTFKRRFLRMIKNHIGTKGAFDKMCDVVKSFEFVNLDTADSRIGWSKAKTVEL